MKTTGASERAGGGRWGLSGRDTDQALTVHMEICQKKEKAHDSVCAG